MKFLIMLNIINIAHKVRKVIRCLPAQSLNNIAIKSRHYRGNYQGTLYVNKVINEVLIIIMR